MAEVLDGMMRLPLMSPTLRRIHTSASILGDAIYGGAQATEPEAILKNSTPISDGLMFLHAAELTFFVSSATIIAQGVADRCPMQRYRPAGLITHVALTVCAPLPDAFVRLCRDLELPLSDRYIRGGLDIDGRLSCPRNSPYGTYTYCRYSSTRFTSRA